jgi:Ca-activated chloride channel family protein
MRKFFAFSFVLFTFFVNSSAQSGRKTLEAPTPTPAPAEVTKDYSESIPAKSRQNSPTTLRGGTVNSTPQTQTTTTQTNNPATVDGDEVLTVETNLITLPVSVFDRGGGYISNLKQEDFKIFENGKEQEVAYFATSEKPFTVLLLLDTSPSASFKIEEIQNAAIAFINQLKPQDKVMVVEFDGNAHVLAELGTDREKTAKGIRKADFGYGTSLYDTMDLSFNKYLRGVEGKKAIVLFTDGVDTTSFKSSYDRTLNESEEADTTIFPIYFDTFADNRKMLSMGGMSQVGTTKLEYALGKKYLNDLADYTGGRVFTPENNSAESLTETFEGIAEELRRQYSIGYYPAEVGQKGDRKSIKVRVNRPNLVIRTRDSYIVGSGTPTVAPTTTKKKGK